MCTLSWELCSTKSYTNLYARTHHYKSRTLKILLTVVTETSSLLSANVFTMPEHFPWVWGVVEECRILHFPLTGCHVTFRTKTLVHTMYKTRHHWLHGPPYLEAVDCSSLLVMAYLAKRRSRVKRCACMEDWTNNMPSLEGMLFGWGVQSTGRNFPMMVIVPYLISNNMNIYTGHSPILTRYWLWLRCAVHR